MKRYQNLGGDAGVQDYEYGASWIRIHFVGDGIYEYTRGSVGSTHLEAMKQRADAGEGLTTYINQHREVREGYARRLA